MSQVLTNQSLQPLQGCSPLQDSSWQQDPFWKKNSHIVFIKQTHYYLQCQLHLGVRHTWGRLPI